MTDHHHLCRRENILLAAAIDRGIAYQQAHGYPRAKFYLMEQAVDQEIIRRVLTCPQRRRASPGP